MNGVLRKKKQQQQPHEKKMGETDGGSVLKI
jgi:hypothetical protein